MQLCKFAQISTWHIPDMANRQEIGLPQFLILLAAIIHFAMEMEILQTLVPDLLEDWGHNAKITMEEPYSREISRPYF